MKLTERVAADLVAAMKERAELRLSVLRMLKAEFQRAQADKGRAAELTEDDAQMLVRRLIKQRKEAAEQYRAAGAAERAEAELAEAAVLEVYLPAQLGDAEPLVAPEPVRAPGISITRVSSRRQMTRCVRNAPTMRRTMKATPPDSLTRAMKNVALMKIRQTSKYVKVPSTRCHT